ncbi:ComEC/Rec2 family competence protein [Candidatus Parcubacteria bacterium]|nr:ComEC/Rec2 family competence protein [Candidatus Parcubacteria bacterium]
MERQTLSARISFFIFAASFTAGIALRSFFEIPLPYLFASLFVFFILLFLAWHTRSKRVFIVSLLILGCIVGVVRFAVSAEEHGSPALSRHAGETVFAEGTIVEEPDAREQTTLLTVKLAAMTGEAQPLNDTVLVGTEPFPSFEYGDRISVRGKLTKPEAFGNETGRVFDYPAYLSVQGIYYKIDFAKVSLVRHGEGNPVRGFLFKLKRRFIERINSLIKEPESSLLAGLLVGAKQSLGAALLDDFRRVGLIHIVVLSGYNLTIVADSIAASVAAPPWCALPSWGFS